MPKESLRRLCTTHRRFPQCSASHNDLQPQLGFKLTLRESENQGTGAYVHIYCLEIRSPSTHFSGATDVKRRAASEAPHVIDSSLAAAADRLAGPLQGSHWKTSSVSANPVTRLAGISPCGLPADPQLLTTEILQGPLGAYQISHSTRSSTLAWPAALRNPLRPQGRILLRHESPLALLLCSSSLFSRIIRRRRVACPLVVLPDFALRDGIPDQRPTRKRLQSYIATSRMV